MSANRLPRDPVVVAARPVIEAIGGSLVAALELQPFDVPLVTDRKIVAVVRPATLHSAMAVRLRWVEATIERRLHRLSSEQQLEVLRFLDDLEVFGLRRSVEHVAEQFGVTPGNIYRYFQQLAMASDRRLSASYAS